MNRVMRRLAAIPFARKVKFILRWIGYVFRKPQAPDEDRFSYQQANVHHRFGPGERVLDIGSGGDPFPYATILAERYISSTVHRNADFRSNGKPVVICDINALPFRENQFDYVACCHVLEHIQNPIEACNEMQRIAKAGLIETPRLMKDALFSWAESIHHKWYLEKIGSHLVFFEYDQVLKKGIDSQAWYELIFGPLYHPMQDAFNDHQELFNILFEWENGFDVTVFYLDGRIEKIESKSFHPQVSPCES